MRNLPTDPRRLPSMPVAQRKAFPLTQGLYFVIAGDEIRYIGLTDDNFRERWCDWGGHKQYAKALKANAQVHFWALSCSGKELDDLETAAIQRWWPRWNTAKKPKRVKPKGNPAKLPPRVPHHLLVAIAAIIALLLIQNHDSSKAPIQAPANQSRYSDRRCQAFPSARYPQEAPGMLR